MLELTEQYIPDKFLFREEQVHKITQTFINFKNKSLANNLILLGTTGAGKTSILQKIILDQNNNLFVSANENRTTNRILKKLSGKNHRSDSELLSSLINQLKQEPKIIVIDEVGKITDIENFCNILNALYRETGIPIIIATNKWTFIEEMPDDARLTLFLNRVEFPCYNAVQLKEILKYRLSLIADKIDFNFSDSSLEYLSSKVVKSHFSSVRIALMILNQCVNAKEDSMEFIEQKIEYLVEQDWRNFIHKLSDIEKEFLNIVLDLSESQDEIPAPCVNMKMSGIASPSKISQLVTTFIDYGLLSAKWKHLGRAGGKHRIISFSKPAYRTKLLKLLNPWEVYENEAEIN